MFELNSCLFGYGLVSFSAMHKIVWIPHAFLFYFIWWAMQVNYLEIVFIAQKMNELPVCFNAKKDKIVSNEYFWIPKNSKKCVIFIIDVSSIFIVVLNSTKISTAPPKMVRSTPNCDTTNRKVFCGPLMFMPISRVRKKQRDRILYNLTFFGIWCHNEGEDFHLLKRNLDIWQLFIAK